MQAALHPDAITHSSRPHRSRLRLFILVPLIRSLDHSSPSTHALVLNQLTLGLRRSASIYFPNLTREGKYKKQASCYAVSRDEACWIFGLDTTCAVSTFYNITSTNQSTMNLEAHISEGVVQSHSSATLSTKDENIATRGLSEEVVHKETARVESSSFDYDDNEQEPEIHARTYFALAAMFFLNLVQVLALQGPPAVVCCQSQLLPSMNDRRD